MKRIIILELCFLFLATTFQSDRMTGWVQQTIPRSDLAVKDLQFVDTLTGFIVSTKPSIDTAFIFRTTDGGNNWSTSSFDSTYLICMDIVDNNVGYCAGAKVGLGIIKKTTNGGNNWYTVSSIPFQIIEDVKFVNRDTGWVCSSNPFDGGLWRTTNGALSWVKQMGQTSGPSKVFFVNSNTGWVIGSSDYKLYKTTNCGVNWVAQAVISNFLADVFFASPDTGFIVGGGSNNLKRTTNGGTTFHNVNVSTYLTTENRLFFINNNIGWAGSAPYKIFATKDGYNWGIQNSPKYANDIVSFVDSLNGWAGASGLVHTTDGGGPITYTGIRRNGEFVPAFELEQNYPNPFNGSTRIRFSIFKSCYLTVKVYNIKGQEVASLISSMGYKPGEYEMNFDTDRYSLGTGVYFYYMVGSTTDNKEIFVDTKKMLLAR